jgi:hypothetical protein
MTDVNSPLVKKFRRLVQLRGSHACSFFEREGKGKFQSLIIRLKGVDFFLSY